MPSVRHGAAAPYDRSSGHTVNAKKKAAQAERLSRFFCADPAVPDRRRAARMNCFFYFCICAEKYNL